MCQLITTLRKGHQELKDHKWEGIYQYGSSVQHNGRNGWHRCGLVSISTGRDGDKWWIRKGFC